LNSPDEFTNRVVEVEAEFGGRTSYGFSTSVLELCDKVLMRRLSIIASLSIVEVDVIEPETDS
jgi:hypothetical protein